MLFADDGAVLACVQRPFAQHFPRDGWVEHDADEIFDSTIACAREALAEGSVGARDVAGIGIAVQRETVVVLSLINIRRCRRIRRCISRW
jgi:glycerol kinase